MTPSTPNRVSVALCTWNGERFLSQQLASIEQQTRLPGELVACDDGSSDRTLAILEDFAARAVFPVKIVRNASTLGSTANFAQCIQLCSSDLIALSDQDDTWLPHRLERSEQELREHPEAGLVFSDAELIDDQNRPLPGTLWQRFGFTGKHIEDLRSGRYGILAKHRFITGATVMFRAGLLDRVLPIADGWIHDEWIAGIAAAFTDLRPIEEPLIRYRIHATQAVGFHNKLEQRAQGDTRAEKHWARLEESVKEVQQLCEALGAMDLPEGRHVLSAYRRHLQFLAFRYGLPSTRTTRLAPILKHRRAYRNHASGLASMLKDLTLKRAR